MTTGQYLMTWIDAGGTSHSLNGAYDQSPAKITAVLGADEIWGSDYNFITQDVPLQPGTRLRFVNPNPRTVVLPLLITASSYSDLAVQKRNIRAWFQPRFGDGILQITSPDGLVKNLTCRAQAIQMTEDDQNSGGLWQVCNITLLAADPFWYETATRAINFSAYGYSGSGTITATATVAVTNSATEEGWPIWTIPYTGSTYTIQQMTLTNTTTGYVIQLLTVSYSSLTLTIDTRPGQKTIVDQSGNNQFKYLSTSSYFWPLAPGVNNLSLVALFSGTGTLPAASGVYTPRWNTP